MTQTATTFVTTNKLSVNQSTTLVETLTDTSNVLTMSSLEIAELTGKRHDHVMRDINVLLTSLYGSEGVLSFGDTYQNVQNKQVYPCFKLPKDECICLVSGYDVKLRMAIIKRWQYLEDKNKTTAITTPVTYLEALKALVVVEEQKLLLQSKIEEDKPKVEFHDAVDTASNGILVRDLAKKLFKNGKPIKEKELREWMKCNGLLTQNNRALAAHVQSGHLFETLCVSNGKQRSTTRITGKGVTYITKKMLKQELIDLMSF